MQDVGRETNVPNEHHLFHSQRRMAVGPHFTVLDFRWRDESQIICLESSIKIARINPINRPLIDRCCSPSPGSLRTSVSPVLTIQRQRGYYLSDDI